jgi:diacylglycerol kinase family enzyme
MRIRVIVNRGGGSAGDDAVARIEALFAAAGADAEVRAVAPEALADECTVAAGAGGIDLVAVAGGDGTLGTAAAALADSGRPLGILPLGTLNHFARDAGIPTDLEGAVAAIAAGRPKRVDIAEVNGKVFVNNSAVGLYPHMVRLREAQQAKGRSKRLAMLSASLATLRSFRKHRLWISAPGLEAPIETPLLFVGNNRYQIDLFALGRREAIDAGELCLYAIRAHNRARLLWAGLRGLFGRLDQQRDFVTAYVTEAEISSDRARLGVATDGEQQGMATPLRYRIRPGALTIMVPKK